MRPSLGRLLATFSLQELRRHPWRSATAVVAVMLGVALAFAVHLINASALAEFASAVSAVNGQPDAELRARQGALDDRLIERIAAHPGVSVASPVIELNTQAVSPTGQAPSAVNAPPGVGARFDVSPDFKAVRHHIREAAHAHGALLVAAKALPVSRLRARVRIRLRFIFGSSNQWLSGYGRSC